MEGAQALLGVVGVVSERVKVKKGFEAAIAAALGSLAEAVLVVRDCWWVVMVAP